MNTNVKQNRKTRALSFLLILVLALSVWIPAGFGDTDVIHADGPVVVDLKLVDTDLTITRNETEIIASTSGGVVATGPVAHGIELTGTLPDEASVFIDGSGHTNKEITLILNNAHIAPKTNEQKPLRAGIALMEKANAILIIKEDSINNVNGAFDGFGNSPQLAGAGIRVPSPQALTITGSGMLNATGEGGTSAGSAAIGGSNNEIPGKITIGGDVTVYTVGGTNAAAIGGGYEGSAENINIVGNADVGASGGEGGAGIGGGNCISGNGGNGNNINISGNAKVSAVGGENGAGIGGGNYGYGKSIRISGEAEVYADGGANGAGIGGGRDEYGSDISISGRFVTACGGSDGDDIGSGYDGTSASGIIITGGSVFAVSGTIGAQPQNDAGDPVYRVTVPDIDGFGNSLIGNKDISVNVSGGAYNAKTTSDKGEHGIHFPSDASAYIYLPVDQYTKIKTGDMNSGLANVVANPGENQNIIFWEKYKVLFDAIGGTNLSMTEKVGIPGESYGTLPTASKTGHTFTGWFTKPTGGEQITDSTVISIQADQTLYAQWKANESSEPDEIDTPKSYTITFKANAKSVKKLSPKKKSVTYGNKFGKLPKPTKKGYKFKGWYTKKKGGSKITAGTKMIFTKNVTLYAQWSPNGKIVKCKAATLRKGPGKSKAIKGYVKKGTKVAVLGKKKVNRKYTWYKVKVGSKTGYIYSKYVKKS